MGAAGVGMELVPARSQRLATIVVERPSKRVIYILPWSAFPVSFKNDVDRFLLRLSGQDLSEDGPPRPARPATLQKRSLPASCGGFRAGVSWLCCRRYRLDRRSPVARALPGNPAVLFGPGRWPVVASGRGDGGIPQGCRQALGKVDEQTLEKMKRITSRLVIPRRGMTAKNRECLRPFDDPESVAAFLGLPQRLRRETEIGKRNAAARRSLSQMAAAIALLQAAPIRLEESYRARRQEEPDRARQAALSGRRRIGGEEQRADRFRAAGGNTGYPGLVRQRASAAFNERTDGRSVPQPARRRQVIEYASSADPPNGLQVYRPADQCSSLSACRRQVVPRCAAGPI